MTIAPKGDDAGGNPAGYFVLLPPQQDKARLDVRLIFSKLLDGWKLILGSAVIFTLLAGIHAFLIAQPVYRSRVLVSVRMEGGALPSGGGQLGSLASMAGINLHTGGTSRTEYIAKLRSRQLMEMLIRQDNLLPVLFAKKYNAETHQWRNPDRAPTMDDGVRAFSEVLLISEDTDTGMLTITVDWKDRFLAAKLVRDIIDLANRTIRTQAYGEAQRNLNYLTGQAKVVEVESLRQSIVNLMETNLNQAMLANAQPDYAFKTLDPPTVADADKFIWPVRRVELLGGFVVGAFLASIFVLWRRRKN